MGNLQHQILPSGGVKLGPSRAEVLGLNVAEIEEVLDVLYLVVLEPCGALVVVREEAVSLIEVMVNVHVKSVGAFELFRRAQGPGW